MESGVPAERFQPDPADKAAEPSGKLIRIARGYDLGSFQRDRHRLVRFHPIATLAQARESAASRMHGGRNQLPCLAMKRFAVNEQRLLLELRVHRAIALWGRYRRGN